MEPERLAAFDDFPAGSLCHRGRDWVGIIFNHAMYTSKKKPKKNQQKKKKRQVSMSLVSIGV